MANLVLGLIGKKRTGKDTFATVLVEQFGYTRVAFADPLRQAALELDPIVGRPALPGQLAPLSDVRLSDVVDVLGWEKAKDYVPEVRRILQRFGTESIRKIDPDFWITQALRTIDKIDGPVVVTDVRYENEAEAIKRLGGLLGRIVRDVPGATDSHPSETALDDYPTDFTVENTDLAVFKDAAVWIGQHAEPLAGLAADYRE